MEKSHSITDNNEDIIKELRMLKTENMTLNKKLLEKNKYIDVISKEKLK